MNSPENNVEVFIPDSWRSRTVQEASDYVNKHKEDGEICPCCNQLCKVYYRKFNRNMAMFLISLAKKSTEEKKWIHYKDCEYSARDYAAVTYWDLASIKNTNAGKAHSGYWLPTRKGVDFINGKIQIPSHVILFDGDIDWSRGGFSSKQLDIKEALGRDFSYEELMGARRIIRDWEVLSEEPRTVEVLRKEAKEEKV